MPKTRGRFFWLVVLAIRLLKCLHVSCAFLTGHEIHFWFLDHTRPTFFPHDPTSLKCLHSLLFLTNLFFPALLLSWKNKGRETVNTLTCIWLVTVVALPEVLWVLDDGDTGHANHYCVWASIQRRRSRDAVVDVMKRAGRIFFPTDHSHRTWRQTNHKMKRLERFTRPSTWNISSY